MRLDRPPAARRRPPLLAIVPCAAALTSVLLGSGACGESALPPASAQVPRFELTDQDGNRFGSAELEGRIYVANFFFTSCRSICLVRMDAASRLERRLAEHGPEGIRFVSISVDPQVDTPEVLADYARSRGIDTSRWTLLTGPVDEIRELAVDGFLLHVGERQPVAAGIYDIAHSARLILVDGNGGIRGYYDTDTKGLDQIYRDVGRLHAQRR